MFPRTGIGNMNAINVEFIEMFMCAMTNLLGLWALSQLSSCIVSFLDLIWVHRLNVRMGISDKVFLLGQEVCTGSHNIRICKGVVICYAYLHISSSPRFLIPDFGFVRL